MIRLEFICVLFVKNSSGYFEKLTSGLFLRITVSHIYYQQAIQISFLRNECFEEHGDVSVENPENQPGFSVEPLEESSQCE